MKELFKIIDSLLYTREKVLLYCDRGHSHSCNARNFQIAFVFLNELFAF
jgi:hypothetical protein